MVTLRRFTHADAPDLRQFRYAGLTDEEIGTMIDDWNRLEFQGRYFEMFAVVSGAQLVGTVSLYQRSDSVISVGPDIFPGFQRRGFGRQAMRLALDAARDKGYKIAAQQVRRDNLPSIALHTSLGFETDHYAYTNAKGQQVLMFLKALF